MQTEPVLEKNSTPSNDLFFTDETEPFQWIGQDKETRAWRAKKNPAWTNAVFRFELQKAFRVTPAFMNDFSTTIRKMPKQQREKEAESISDKVGETLFLSCDRSQISLAEVCVGIVTFNRQCLKIADVSSSDHWFDQWLFRKKIVAAAFIHAMREAISELFKLPKKGGFEGAITPSELIVCLFRKAVHVTEEKRKPLKRMAGVVEEMFWDKKLFEDFLEGEFLVLVNLFEQILSLKS